MSYDYQNIFRSLLRTHFKAGYLRDKRILNILGDIPLNRIYDENQIKRFVLEDSPVLIYFKDRNNVRTCSAPHMISMMTSMLELNPTDRVLILGSKGGLIEVTIAKAVQQVFILEEHPDVAMITEQAFVSLGQKNIWVHQQNPLFGLKEEGQFDKILITGAIPYLPNEILNQLSPNGIIVYPMMLMHPNQQIILQIVKHESNEDLDILNFGGVIFTPLYVKEPPPLNKLLDITLPRIIQESKMQQQPDLLAHKQFFEEFRNLPKIEFIQIVFNEGEQLQYVFDAEGKAEINQTLAVFVQHPGIHTFLLNFQYKIPGTENISTNREIELSPQSDNKISFDVKFPVKEGSYEVILTGTGPNHYRVVHSHAIIHISQFDRKQENLYNLSIDFEGPIDIEEDF